jgi:hypothetical protein
MSPAPSVSTPAESDSPSYAVHLDAGLLSPFNLKRGAYFLLVPLPLLALCVHFGQGVFGLALLAVASWPFRPRCRLEVAGIRIAWLFVEERVPWNEILDVALGEDARRGIVGKRPLVLTIERRGRPRLALRGRAATLVHLNAELARRT